MRKNGLASLLGFYLIILIDNLGVSLVIPVLVPIAYDANQGLISTGSPGFRDVFYGIAIGSYSLAMFFGSPLLGALSDDLRRKKTLALCLTGLTAGYALTVLAITQRDVTLFVAGRLLAGFFSGSLPVAQAAILDVTPEDRRVKAIGRVMFCVSMGYVIGPLIGGYLSDSTLVSWFDLTTPFIFVTLATVVNLLIVLVAFREEPVARPSGKFSFPNPLKRLVSAFRFPGIRLWSVVLLLMSLGWTGFFQYVGLYLAANKGFDHREVTNLISVVGIGLAAAFLALVPLSVKYLKPAAAISVSLFVMTACIAGTVAMDSRAALHALALVGAAGYGISYSGLLGQLSSTVDNEHQGSVMGMAAAIAASSAGVSGIVFGMIDGTSWIPIITAAVLIFLGGVLTVLKTAVGGKTPAPIPVNEGAPKP
jgi:DHA1 family tetracycline resistance protein-like MFS transporter